MAPRQGPRSDGRLRSDHLNHDPRLTRRAEPRERRLAIACALVIHGTGRLDLALSGRWTSPGTSDKVRCTPALLFSVESECLFASAQMRRFRGASARSSRPRCWAGRHELGGSGAAMQLLSGLPTAAIELSRAFSPVSTALERQWRVRFCPFCRDITPARPGSGAICSFNCCMLLSLAPPYRPSTTSAPGGHCRARAPAPERTFRGGRIGAARGPKLEAQQGRAQ